MASRVRRLSRSGSDVSKLRTSLQAPLTFDFDTLTLLNQRVRCTLQDVITYHLITIKDCTPVQYKNPPDGQCVRGIFVV
jgi:hypothetical protein